MTEDESLADAVDRLLDQMFDELTLTREHYSAAFLEAVEMARLAYLRERAMRGEFHTNFPQVWKVSP